MQTVGLTNEMPARVRNAVAESAYGPSLFPNWRFHVSKTLGRLTVRAPGMPISACWEWDSDMRDDDIALAIEMLVVMYLRELQDDHGIDLDASDGLIREHGIRQRPPGGVVC